jgi:hypothetical protein
VRFDIHLEEWAGHYFDEAANVELAALLIEAFEKPHPALIYPGQSILHNRSKEPLFGTKMILDRTRVPMSSFHGNLTQRYPIDSMGGKEPFSRSEEVFRRATSCRSRAGLGRNIRG